MVSLIGHTNYYITNWKEKVFYYKDMELLLIHNKTYRLSVGVGISCFFVVLIAIMAIGSFYAGGKFVEEKTKVSYSALRAEKDDQWRHEFEKQHRQIILAKESAEQNLDVLSARLSTMQAHLLRLDALGARLISLANMSDQEFNILDSPGLGGPSTATAQNSLDEEDFIEALQMLGRKIADRNEKFSAIESMLMDSNIQSQTLLEGSPVSGGWTSSLFGWRSDPMSGKKEFHRGIDLAGQPGSKVSSVAAGIVLWSEYRAGYGNMVEIGHVGGYVTRYAHNKKNLVAVGDKVEKGQAVAVLGSSGRSTGPHVHFEVIKNGKHVNPAKFVTRD